MPYPIVQVTTVLKPGLTAFDEVLVKLDRPTKPGSTLVVQVVSDGDIGLHNAQGLVDLGPKSLSDNKFNKYINLQIQTSGWCQNDTWYCVNAKEKTRNLAIKFKSNKFDNDGTNYKLSFAAVIVVELYSHVKKYDSWYPISSGILNATSATVGPLSCTGYDVLLAIATFQSSPHTYSNLSALGLDAIDQILNQAAPLSVAVWHGASGAGSASMDVSWGAAASRASLVGLAFKTDDPDIIVFPDPTPIVGNLQNPDGTGANGVLMLALNRPAVTHLGLSVSDAAVLIPFVDGSIVGSFSVYGNDLLKGETCYRAIFYDLQGNALLNTCIDIPTDVSFDVASITV